MQHVLFVEHKHRLPLLKSPASLRIKPPTRQYTHTHGKWKLGALNATFSQVQQPQETAVDIFYVIDLFSMKLMLMCRLKSFVGVHEDPCALCAAGEGAGSCAGLPDCTHCSSCPKAS